MAIALVLSALTASLSVVSPAQARQLSPEVDESLDSVRQAYEREVLGRTTTLCDESCSRLAQDLKRTPTNVPGAHSVSRGLTRSAFDKTVSAARTAWRFSKPFRITTAGAALVGGEFLIKKLVVGTKDMGVVEIPQSTGSIVAWEWSTPTEPAHMPTFYASPNPMPHGMVAMSNNRGAIIWQAAAGPTQCNEPPVTLSGSLAQYAVPFSYYWNRCFVGYDQPTPTVPLYGHSYVIPFETMLRLFGSGTTAPPGTPSADAIHPQEGLTTAELTQRIRDVLQSDNPAFRDLQDWIDNILGGPSENPRYEYRTIPHCADATASICTDRLRDAGFTADIDTESLSQDDAIMEVNADRVTETNPPHSTRARRDEKVVINKNPDPMPEMTPTETQIADDLETKNPATVTEENKKTIARTCVRLATAEGSGIGAQDCLFFPIFVTGNDAAVPAANDRAALTRRASWVLLHNREAPTKVSWYTGLPGCTQAEKPEAHVMASPQCDEYPFWTTLEAHDGAFNKLSDPGYLRPSIKWAAQKENGRQGGALKHFFSSNIGGSGPNAYPFDGCGIPAQDEAAMSPDPISSRLQALPSAFLNVPLGAHAPFKTIGFCNRP